MSTFIVKIRTFAISHGELDGGGEKMVEKLGGIWACDFLKILPRILPVLFPGVVFEYFSSGRKMCVFSKMLPGAGPSPARRGGGSRVRAGGCGQARRAGASPPAPLPPRGRAPWGLGSWGVQPTGGWLGGQRERFSQETKGPTPQGGRGRSALGGQAPPPPLLGFSLLGPWPAELRHHVVAWPRPLLAARPVGCGPGLGLPACGVCSGKGCDRWSCDSVACGWPVGLRHRGLRLYSSVAACRAQALWPADCRGCCAWWGCGCGIGRGGLKLLATVLDATWPGRA